MEYCKNCGNLITGSGTKFCCRSCATSFNNIFRYHDINPVSYRKYIKNIFYIPNAEIIKNAKYFNGKKVLVIDDTIATGKSMADCCQTIIDTFDCKSITILTLFSRL